MCERLEIMLGLSRDPRKKVQDDLEKPILSNFELFRLEVRMLSLAAVEFSANLPHSRHIASNV